MVGVLGLALISASVLLLFYVARQRNSLTPPRWSRWSVTEHTTLLLFLVGSVFGGSLILLAFIQKDGPGLGLTELALTLGVAGVTVLCWRLISQIPRLVESANTVSSAPSASGASRKRAA
jgi:hypothetical protein